MSKYDFSLAKPGDIPEIIEIYRSLIGAPGCAWSLDYPDEEIVKSDVENKSLYILKEKEQIIAVASAGESDELSGLPWTLKKPCDFARIGVVSAFQRQGVGTIILQNVIQAAAERGFDGIRMLVGKTNPPALALYRRNGFAKCGEAFMYGIDFYCYQLRFSPAP